MPAVVVWNTEVPAKFIATAKRGLANAAHAIESKMVDKLSTPGPPPSEAGSSPRIDTGMLVSSINAVEFNNGFKWRIGPTLPDGLHGAFLEFGTETMAPRPFVRPAYDEIRPRLVKMVAGG